MDMFGITLVLPECAFAAELQRETIPEMMRDIDDQLTEQGAPDEALTRHDLMIRNALMISHMLASHEIDHEAGVADIAYSFIYAFGKSIGGFEKIDTMRGLIGTYLHNRLDFNPCLGAAEYDQETMILQQRMADHDDDNFERGFLEEPRPTVH